MHYKGGSIRTYVNANAVDPDGNGNPSDSLWKDFGIFEPGIYSELITAHKVDAEENPVYLLVFDTSQLSESADDFTVSSDGVPLYQGGLHRYAYLNETLHKDSQIAIDFTIDNWVALDDANLYLYLTEGEHALKVNGQDFTVAFDEETNTFTVTPATPAPSVGPPQSGDLDGDGYPTAGEALQVARAVISGSATWSAEMKAAADMDGDGYLTMADVVRILRKAAGLT
jgi:hypothetical protein